MKKLITVTNPNNPMGALLNEEDCRTIIELADRDGAWFFSDGVYQGTELDGALISYPMKRRIHIH